MGYIYTSSDSGSTWTEQTDPGTGSWYGISSSSDGSKIATVNINDYIFTGE